MSPIFNVPLETNNVATTPLPASILDSTTTPEASPFLTAFNSNNSAWRFIADNKSSIFVFLRAETSTDTTSPPTSSVITLFCSFSSNETLFISDSIFSFNSGSVLFSFNSGSVFWFESVSINSSSLFKFSKLPSSISSLIDTVWYYSIKLFFKFSMSVLNHTSKFKKDF